MKFDQFVLKIIVSALKVEIRTTKNKGIKIETLEISIFKFKGTEARIVYFNLSKT